MDDALIACRAVHFGSALLVFGMAAFRLYGVDRAGGALLALDRRLRPLLLAAAIVVLLSALALVPLVAGRMAGSAVAVDWQTLSTVLWQTAFGRVWRVHLLLASCLILAVAVPSVPPAARAALAALMLGSLGGVGHAAAGQGLAGLGREANDTVHLLAGGLWLGGLAPLGMLARRAWRSSDPAASLALRLAVGRFSLMAYGAVALVAATGIVNSVVLVGSVEALMSTDYGRLLLIKIALFLLLLAVAAINRLILVPRIAGDDSGQRSAAALSGTIAAELGLGLGIFAVVGILGTLPPGMHLHMHAH